MFFISLAAHSIIKESCGEYVQNYNTKVEQMRLQFSNTDKNTYCMYTKYDEISRLTSTADTNLELPTNTKCTLSECNNGNFISCTIR